MTEEQYLDALAAGRNSRREISRSTMDLADRAVAEHPDSAELWTLRGDLIQLGDKDVPHELEEALLSYTRAAEIDPTFAYAFESIGYFHDVHTGDFKAALRAFRRAVECGAGTDTFIGLARVLSQTGAGTEEIQSVLSAAPDQTNETLAEFRAELENGSWEHIRT